MNPDQNLGGPRPPKVQEVKFLGGQAPPPGPPPRTAYVDVLNIIINRQ